MAKVQMPPADVMDQGRMAFVVDPSGARIGVWQAGKQRGAARKDEPGAFTWVELMAPDLAPTLAFYRALLGVDVEEVAMPDGSTYHVMMADGQQLAGAMAPPPADIPPCWSVHFFVTDVGSTRARVEELDGTVVVPPFDVEGVGRLAVLADAQAGTFNVMTPLEQPAQR